MRKLLFYCFPLLLSFSSPAQPKNDTTTFFIHKFEQNIGKEICVASRLKDTVNYSVNFRYTDRGSPVQLNARIQLNTGFYPLSFWAKGGTSRFSTVHDSVVVHGKTAVIKVDDSSFVKPLSANTFFIAGYSPATAQMLLIRYWQKQRQPASLTLLPYGTVGIRKDGEDTLGADHKLRLNRYVISGLVWGNELLWVDNEGQLYCLITNDAEGDKQEIMLAPYESFLPQLIEKAAVYGMRLFTKSAKPSAQKHSLLAIEGGTLLDVIHGKKISNATVLIENGMIKAAGEGTSVNVPGNAYVINAKGKTILPGLWDMHAHFEQAEWGPAYLAAGVTTVRDCGNEFGYINTVQQTIDKDGGIGPHILKAGIIDGKGPYALGIIQADTREEAVAAVDRYAGNGFAQIKIYSSVKPEIVKAVCDEAHKRGLTVTGHIPEAMTLQQGIDSGMDMVNHVQYVSAVLKKGKERYTVDFDDSVSRGVFAFLKQHRTVIDPTLGVFELAFRSLKDSITQIEPGFATLPPPLQVIFKNTGLPAGQYEAFGRKIMETFTQTVTRLYKDGIPFVAGTDMGFPGLSLDRELELYVACGLTPLQAIQTATITPATVMKMGEQTGSVDTGKQADILLVNGDPSADIRKIRNVSLVIKKGNLYDPAELRRLAGFAK